VLDVKDCLPFDNRHLFRKEGRDRSRRNPAKRLILHELATRTVEPECLTGEPAHASSDPLTPRQRCAKVL
jgi:hypothetical protein